jgi:hypothetical protein
MDKATQAAAGAVKPAIGGTAELEDFPTVTLGKEANTPVRLRTVCAAIAPLVWPAARSRITCARLSCRTSRGSFLTSLCLERRHSRSWRSGNPANR